MRNYYKGSSKVNRLGITALLYNGPFTLLTLYCHHRVRNYVKVLNLVKQITNDLQAVMRVTYLRDDYYSTL